MADLVRSLNRVPCLLNRRTGLLVYVYVLCIALGVEGVTQGTTTIARDRTTIAQGTTTIRSATTTMRPATTTMRPATTTMGPGTTTVGPGTTTVGPGTTTMGPGTTTIGPGTTTVGPATTTMGPTTTTMGPATTTMGPATTTMGPTTTTMGPATTTVSPGTTTTRLATTTITQGIRSADSWGSMDLAILVYASSSTNFNAIKSGVVEILRNIPIDSPTLLIRVAFASINAEGLKVRFGLLSFSTAHEIMNEVNVQSHEGDSTFNLIAALNQLHTGIFPSGTSSPNVVWIITDTDASVSQAEAESAIASARSNGVDAFFCWGYGSSVTEAATRYLSLDQFQNRTRHYTYFLPANVSDFTDSARFYEERVLFVLHSARSLSTASLGTAAGAGTTVTTPSAFNTQESTRLSTSRDPGEFSRGGQLQVTYGHVIPALIYTWYKYSMAYPVLGN